MFMIPNEYLYYYIHLLPRKVATRTAWYMIRRVGNSWTFFLRNLRGGSDVWYLVTIDINLFLVKWQPSNMVSTLVCNSGMCSINSSHKSHDTLDKYPTRHHFATEMCTHMHISVTNRYVVRLWDWCIVVCVQQVFFTTVIDYMYCNGDVAIVWLCCRTPWYKNTARHKTHTIIHDLALNKISYSYFRFNDEILLFSQSLKKKLVRWKSALHIA